MDKKALKNLEKDIVDWQNKASAMADDLAKEKLLASELKVSIAHKVLAGGNVEELSTEQAHIERRIEALDATYKAIQNRLKDKAAELDRLQHKDAEERQASLKAEADAAILEYVKAQKASWEASLKLAQLSRQEQAEFCGPFRLPAVVDGGRWSIEAERLESYIDGTLGFSDPGLVEKAGLSNSERSKIKAQLA